MIWPDFCLFHPLPSPSHPPSPSHGVLPGHAAEIRHEIPDTTAGAGSGYFPSRKPELNGIRILERKC